jgi:hypothetical protein
MFGIKAKKGMQDGLTTGILALGLAAIAYFISGFMISIGANLNTQLGSSYSNTSTAYNVTSNVNSGYNTFASYMPTIATVVVAVIIIGLLFLVFAYLVGNRQGGV